MKHVSILGKVLCLVAAFALFVVGAMVFATGKMRTIDDTYSDLSNHQGAANVLLTRSSRATWAMRTSIADLLLANTDEGDKAAKQSFAQQHAEFVSYIDQVAVLLPNDAAKFTDLKQKVLTAVDQTCAETIRLGEAADKDNALKSQAVYVRDCVPSLNAVAVSLKTAVDDLVKETKVANDATTDVTNFSIHLTWTMILGGLVLVLVGAFFSIRQWISKPLMNLVATLSVIAGGDYQATVIGEDRKDEVGAMARVAKVFQKTGLDKVALEAETTRQREAAEEKRQQDEVIQKQLAEQQAQVVTGLASGLGHLSDGDLMFRLNQPFASDYEKLRADFNAAIAKLQETITVISGSTAAIRAGTAEISTASDDLSRRTEQQAASLEETAAALDEITATVKKTSEGSTHARKVVADAKADAEHSGVVVGQAVEAMSAIEHSSGKISQIIGVIDEIAFQTNLLALNAGVEAARAGEAGRGFAVVASEVRALAQRSAEAAKEIKALISTSSQQVSAGVGLVSETGAALKRIVIQVAEINAVVSDIATSTQEQATALQEVNTAINQMDQVTQQNAAMVEESTAASRNLASETEELSRLIGQFQVADEAPTSRPVVRSRAVSQPVKAMRTVGRGGAALKPQEASWEEF